MGVIFFGLLLTLLLSLARILLRGDGRLPSRRASLMVNIAVIFTVLLLMFRSVQSLNWTSGLSMLLIAIGLLFYSGRRA